MPSGPRIRANNVYGLISDNPLAIGATTFNSSGLSVLPDVTAAHAVVVLDPKRVFGEPEIVVVTAHTALTTFATITRAQYGTIARSHPMNTSWAHVPIDEDFIEICTSVTHPSNPYVGQMIFETDLLTYKSWNGVSWVDVGSGAAIFQDPSPPPGPAAGTLWLDTDEGAATGLSSIIAYAEVSANQTGISTSNVDLTGLSVTITVPAGRRIRITGQGVFITTAGTPTIAALQIFEGATRLSFDSTTPNAQGTGATVISTISPSAGSHTYKLVAVTDTGTVLLNGSATLHPFILVEDITGTLWPAGTVITSNLFSSEAWASWTPTLANWTVGSGTLNAKYIKFGRTVHYRLRFIYGAGSAVGTGPTFTLPVPAHSDYVFDFPIGTITFLDAGVTGYSGFAIAGDGTNIRLTRIGGSGSANVGVSATAPITFATGDEIQISGTYEAVS